MNSMRGPLPEEYADFEQASRPRRQPITYNQVLHVVAGATVFFLVATMLVAAMQWFSDNSSDHLILGTWRSDDHPQFAKLHFSNNGFVALTDKAGRLFT